MTLDPSYARAIGYVLLVAFIVVTPTASFSMFVAAIRSLQLLRRGHYMNEPLALISINPLDTIKTLSLIEDHARHIGDSWTARFARVAVISHVLWYSLVLLI